MAAGDISKQIKDEIRTRFNDHNRVLFKTDDVIFNLLAEAELKICTQHMTTQARIEIRLARNTKEYSFPENLLSITEYKLSPETDTTVLLPLINEETRQFYFSADDAALFLVGGSDPAPANKILVDGFIIPVVPISEAVDPILNRLFYDDLKNWIYSKYRHIDPSFDKLEDVQRSITITRNKFIRTNRNYSTKLKGLKF